MIRALVVAAFLGCSSAFVPARQSSRNGVVMMAERSKSIPFLLKPVKVGIK